METYKITYEKTGKTITYAVLTSAQKFSLRSIEPEQNVVSEMGIMTIRCILKIGTLTDEELTYVRNAVVRMFSEVIEFERTAYESYGQKGELVKQHAKNYDDAMTRMSMITAVIDQEKWQRGLAV